MTEIEKARKALEDFKTRRPACPICKRDFRGSDACPHSRGGVEDYLQEQVIRAIVRDELIRTRTPAQL